MSDEVIENIKARAAKARRLADMTHNQEMRSILLDMAVQGEADVKKLQAERDGL